MPEATSVQQQFTTFLVDNLLLGRKVDLTGVPSFLEAGLIDSTGVLEIVHFIEDTWGITVKDDEIVPANLDSIGNLCAFVGRKLAG